MGLTGDVSPFQGSDRVCVWVPGRVAPGWYVLPRWGWPVFVPLRGTTPRSPLRFEEGGAAHGWKGTGLWVGSRPFTLTLGTSGALRNPYRVGLFCVVVPG